MFLIGLTGGIGSGKSTALKVFGKLGAYTIDADVLARRVVEPGRPAYLAIKKKFGPKVFHKNGTLNRQKLAKIVFGDKKALGDLNKIVHPHIKTVEDGMIKEIADRDKNAVVVVDASLMIEAGYHKTKDVLVVMSSGRENRMARLLKKGKFTRADIENRMDSQMPLKKKLRCADYVIENNGSLNECRKNVEKVYQRIIKAYFKSKPLTAGTLPSRRGRLQRQATVARVQPGSSLIDKGRLPNRNKKKKLKILFASAEVAGFCKTGGLADVASSLPCALSALGHKVIVVMPLYGGVSVNRKNLKPISPAVTVEMNGRKITASFLKGKLDKKTDIFFLRQHQLYGKRKNPYGDEKGDYHDNDARFTFFSRALMELPKITGFKPDVIHVNDWHLGLVPAYLKTAQGENFPAKTASVFSIHNLAYQGLFQKKSMRFTGLPDSLFNPDGVEWYGKLGMLKAGIMFADAITTVSPTYAREILTSSLGFGLEGILKWRRKNLCGILNGIDTAEWNPQTDKHIPHCYSSGNSLPKAVCKSALLKEFSLEEKHGRPLVGMVSRLVEQKGFGLLIKAEEELLKLDFSLVVLGSGSGKYKDFLTGLRKKYPSRVGIRLGFDDALAHRIEAGSDMFLMPSHFEPCGLNQMYSLRYGTIPIVHRVGGLADTVKNWSSPSGAGNGFMFNKPTVRALLGAMKRAFKTYENRKEWRKIMKNAMAQDNSWKNSAERYAQLYEKLIGR